MNTARARRGGSSSGGDGGDHLRRSLATGAIDPVYVLYGDEPAAIRAAIEAIRAAVIPPDDAQASAMAAFNHERFDGAEVRSLSQVLEACAQVPMMSAYRLVELANPDDLGTKKVDSEGMQSTRDNALAALATYIKAPVPTTVLVIHGSGIDGRSKIVNAAKKAARAHRFAGLESDGDALDFVFGEARRRRRELDEQAGRALVEAIGTKKSELVMALDRIVLYAGDRHELKLADVESVVVSTREANVFNLTDAVGRGELQRALTLLAQMYRSGEKNTGVSMRLFALLVRHMRLVFAAKAAPRGQVAAVLGLPPFIANKYEEQARAFNEQRLRAAYAGLVRLDHDLKGGSRVAYLSPYIAIQRWILDVCQALPGVDSRR